jgi:hypothetical protein
VSGILWRIIIAVVCVLLFLALLPPFLRLLGLDVSDDVLTILRVCVAGLAILYVIRGPSYPAIP